MKPSTRNARIFARMLYEDRKREIIKEKGSFHGEAKRLKEEIARHCDLKIDTLDQDLRRGKLDVDRLGWSVQDRFQDWYENTHNE